MTRLVGTAILLDLDGVLVDSTAAIERAWATWAKEAGADEEAVLDAVHGRSAEHSILAGLPTAAPNDIEAAVARVFELQLEDLDGLVAVDGAASLLSGLEDGPHAVVTGCTGELARRRLRASGLPVPELIVGADAVSRGKPDPEGYLTAAFALGVVPAGCIVIEDSPSGVQAAKGAGMTVVGVTTTHAADVLGHADVVTDSPEDLAVADVRGGVAIRVGAEARP
ncbi:HAD-IA family hydrolase [Svornostia abyssi]|uniref:HAD-IA family hydrolase n=1 Tax=Svornostia abyssi TaxID=2898438 RepID=A0ABY5PGU5_9ACTN|nr:HAD-IA family hydrolase [Parviterribacteraceae bacterium J379]